MSLVFDTSILIDLERKKETTIKGLEDLSKTYPSPAKISFVNEFEFLWGIKDKNLKNKEKVISFLNNFVVLHTTSKTSKILVSLKHKYDKKGLALPLADLLIASLAIENNGVLVTKDKDFLKIEELKKVIL